MSLLLELWPMAKLVVKQSAKAHGPLVKIYTRHGHPPIRGPKGGNSYKRKRLNCNDLCTASLVTIYFRGQ